MEVVLTSQGRKQLEAELEELKVKTRNEVAEKIRIAREFGDISENAEYDAAKEEQAMIEGRIIELEQKLANARTIDDKIDTSSVSIGCTVKILDVEYNEETEYKIVGSMEADPMKNKISNESPVGRALMGKKKNESVKVQTPSGVIEIKVLKISG